MRRSTQIRCAKHHGNCCNAIFLTTFYSLIVRLHSLVTWVLTVWTLLKWSWLLRRWVHKTPSKTQTHGNYRNSLLKFQMLRRTRSRRCNMVSRPPLLYLFRTSTFHSYRLHCQNTRRYVHGTEVTALAHASLQLTNRRYLIGVASKAVYTPEMFAPHSYLIPLDPIQSPLIRVS